MEGFSIIMPTYNQAHFIRRAILSVWEQTYTCWELIIINDGSTDNTERYIQDFLRNPKIRYLKNEVNQGIGYSINRGLEIAQYDLIAYLPSDDYYYKDHLLIHKKEYDHNLDLFLTFTKAFSKIEDSFVSQNRINAQRSEICNLFYNSSLQLVQTVHRKTSEKWEICNDMISKDYYKMYWSKLVMSGDFKPINLLTCCWSIRSCKERIQKEEIYLLERKFLLENVDKYQKDGETCDVANSLKTPLKILLVGELSHNPDRILALKDAGCDLFGLWIDKPLWSNIGPIVGITDISLTEWQSEIKRIRPDIIYGLLNYMSVPLAHEVLMNTKEIPFVWHFKEGPYVCQHRNMWDKLIDLYTLSDGQIYINEECQAWFEQYMPCSNKETSFILDGDLPSDKYLNNNFSSKLSKTDGEIHILSSGRLVGLSLNDINYLCQQKIHIHSYGSNSPLVYCAQQVNPTYFHVHGYCSPKDWVTEYSQYDAGLSHCFQSKNYNELVRMSWDDLNIPAKISTFAIAGLPMIQRNNFGHIVATQRIADTLDCNISFGSLEELAEILRNTKKMAELTHHIMKQRDLFVFDTHVSALMDFFRAIIKIKELHQNASI